MITRRFKEDATINRFNTEGEESEAVEAVEASLTKDAGTLFKDAYHKLKHTREISTSMKASKEFELQMMETKNSNSADLM
jgi:hypothetical protein